MGGGGAAGVLSLEPEFEFGDGGSFTIETDGGLGNGGWGWGATYSSVGAMVLVSPNLVAGKF